MSVCSFWSFSSGDGSEETTHSKRNYEKRIIHKTIHTWRCADVLFIPFFFSTLFSGGRSGLRFGFSGLDLIRKSSSDKNEWMNDSVQYESETKTADICHSHPWPIAKKAKLAIRSGWEGWHTLSPLSIRATLTTRRGLWAHVCKIVQTLRWLLHYCPVILHKQQFENIQRLASCVSEEPHTSTTLR